jgi:integrase
MSILNLMLTFDSENAYDYAYDYQMRKNFSNPTIYIANGDLTKRWYVYFSYRNPETGKLKRVTPIYGNVNKFKTKEERLYVLSIYRKKLLKLLKAGFNPFEDNTDLYQKYKSKEEKDQIQEAKNVEKPLLTVRESFDFALSLKEKMVSAKTMTGYRSKTNKFIDWLAKNKPEIKTIDQLTKGTVITFLNDVLKDTSARNRNNYRVDLGSLMQTLEDNELVKQNFIKKIPVLKSTPERNKTYTLETQEEIFSHLEEIDPLLLLYIKFISYNFLRPIEVNRLKVGDINLKEKTIRFKAKNSPFKTKIIPDLLLQELPDLEKLKKKDFLFTPEKLGGQWEATEESKRDYFTKRFKKVVKQHFNLGADYGLYSFRHTSITKVYRNLREEHSPNEAKGRLMQITGHSSMSALEKYLRDIDAELPTDYSAMLT